jgi:hypothetical protein
METAKVLFGRLFQYVVALIPGGAALLVWALHHRQTAASFWELPSLRYDTKILVVVGCEILLGWSLVVGFGLVLNILGGIVAGFSKPQSSGDLKSKPWQVRIWRSALASYLGKAAPRDIEPISDESLNAQLDAANRLPEPQRTQAIVAAYERKGQADLNDFEWLGWWNYFHYRLLTGAIDADGAGREALEGSFCTASVVLMCAMPWTPELRMWWVKAVCGGWIVLMILRSIAVIRNFRDPWSTYTAQMQYLQDRLDGEVRSAARVQGAGTGARL